MSLSPSELSFLLCACAAALPLVVLRAAGPPQQGADAGAGPLVAQIDAARGKPATQPDSLVVEGTFTITFADVPAAGSVMKGTFRETFAGSSRARHECDLGDGVLEFGITEELAWEIDPVMGAKVFAGPHARTIRRWFALLRGASPRELYQGIGRAGTRELDGRPHVLLRMQPAEGRADTWYVDPETGIVGRIDMTLPATEGSQSVWGMEPEMDTQITFGDWRRVGGVLYPHHRASKMGPATFTYTCTKVERGVTPDPERLAPPEAVRRARSRPATRPAGAGGQATVQIVERDAQRVASIRVTCKPDEISATLAVVLPEIMAHLTASGAGPAAPPFARYHAVGEAAVELEAGFPVAAPVTEKGRVKNSELPAGRTAMAWHIGPYEQLRAAHESLAKDVAAQGLRPRGGPWEIYWTDPGMVPDPAKWRTQLLMAVEQ